VADERDIDVAIFAVRCGELGCQGRGQGLACFVECRKPPHDGHRSGRGLVRERVEIEFSGDGFVLPEQRQQRLPRGLRTSESMDEEDCPPGRPGRAIVANRDRHAAALCPAAALLLIVDFGLLIRCRLRSVDG